MLVGYGVVAFGILQAIEPIMHGLHWPDVVLSYVVVGLAIGFPVSVILAWAFDVSAGKIERTAATPGSPKGVRLGLLLLGIGLLAAAPGAVWYLFLRAGAHPPTADADAQLKAKLDAVPPGSDITAPPSIAVLPFVDLSPAKDQEYFSDGLTEEILNALAQVEGLQVAGRTSAFSFKGKNEDLRSIGKQLGVNHVLEGSVRKAGTRLRITAQMINVADGFHLWSENFDRELTDVFVVQEEIARAVATVLRVKLLPGRQAIPNARRTSNQEAYASYLRGRQLFQLQTTEGYRQSVEAFEKAVALDPNYGPAHAALGLSLAWSANSDPDSKVDRLGMQERSSEEVEKAVALSPELADSWLARSAIRINTSWDWAGARADLERARALTPGDARVELSAGHLLAVEGRLPEAIATERRAVELDPLDPLGWDYLGRYLTASGDLAQARAAFARSLQAAPGGLWATRELAFTYLLSNEPAAAFALSEKQPGWLRLLGAALAQHDLGHQAEAKAALDSLIAQPDPPCFQIAQVYGWWGDLDHAFEWLERGRRTKDAGTRYIKYDPLLRKLRGDPRYTAFLRELKLPVDQ